MAIYFLKQHSNSHLSSIKLSGKICITPNTQQDSLKNRVVDLIGEAGISIITIIEIGVSEHYA